MQNIKPPLNGDDAAIKKYAKDMEALRKKVGAQQFASAQLFDAST